MTAKFLLNFSYGIWGNLLKIFIILLCIGIILLLSAQKTNNIFCKMCKKRVGKRDAYCKHCGGEMTDDHKEIIIGISKKTKIISGLTITVLCAAIGVSVLGVVKNIGFSGYGTGFYVGYEQLSNEDSLWEVRCSEALTSGSFYKTLSYGSSHDELVVKSQVDSGNLQLEMQQGDRKESFDITNTNGEIRYPLSDYDMNSEIELNVKHSKAENVDFKVYLE